jgi:DNA modification methylase
MNPPITIGPCQLYLGDCLEILPTLQGVDAVVTDPPYEISAAGGGIGGKRQYLSDIKGHLDGGFEIGVLSGFGSWTCFCAKASLVGLIQQAELQKLRWQLITWNKTNPTPLCNRNYLPDTEYIVHAFTKLPECDYRDKSRWILGPVEQNEIDHPTVKPLYVMERLMQTACAADQTILDPYMGSGTTGIACIRTGRRFIGIEIDENYFRIACDRIARELQQLKLPI